MKTLLIQTYLTILEALLLLLGAAYARNHPVICSILILCAVLTYFRLLLIGYQALLDATEGRSSEMRLLDQVTSLFIQR